jgi:hypothetical protein
MFGPPLLFTTGLHFGRPGFPRRVSSGRFTVYTGASCLPTLAQNCRINYAPIDSENFISPRYGRLRHKGGFLKALINGYDGSKGAESAPFSALSKIAKNYSL